MEGITPALVSHTAGAPIKGGTGQFVKILGSSQGLQGPGGHFVQPSNPVYPAHQQSAEDMNMDSSMHQSFINLIYPSKSKKLMSSELAASKEGSGPQHPHHQKSKSLYVGSTQHMVQNFVKPVAHQLAPKGASGPTGSVQKIQSSNYKKQSSIFNYSQRFKELLNDTMGEEPMLKHGGGTH